MPHLESKVFIRKPRLCWREVSYMTRVMRNVLPRSVRDSKVIDDSAVEFGELDSIVTVFELVSHLVLIGVGVKTTLALKRDRIEHGMKREQDDGNNGCRNETVLTEFPIEPDVIDDQSCDDKDRCQENGGQDAPGALATKPATVVGAGGNVDPGATSENPGPNPVPPRGPGPNCDGGCGVPGAADDASFRETGRLVAGKKDVVRHESSQRRQQAVKPMLPGGAFVNCHPDILCPG